MENFIDYLDKQYDYERIINQIEPENRDFWIFRHIVVSIGQKINTNFVARKDKFTKFLYTKENCRVYFSDGDILTMLLQLRDTSTMDWLVERLKKAYKGEFEKYQIFIAGEGSFSDDRENEKVGYLVDGIGLTEDEQILTNPQDIDIPFKELLILINLILAKDRAAEELQEPQKAKELPTLQEVDGLSMLQEVDGLPMLQEVDGLPTLQEVDGLPEFQEVSLQSQKPDFSKETTAKYISLLRFYYYGDEKAAEYLKNIGYDVESDIYSNYDTKEKRDEKNSLFTDFNLFEKSGLL